MLEGMKSMTLVSKEINYALEWYLESIIRTLQLIVVKKLSSLIIILYLEYGPILICCALFIP